MIRLIKRYGSRKLYDTEESRYVSLEEVADFVRSGQDVRVIDNATEEDVTVQTLTQVISEEGRSGRRTIPIEVLHELIRYSGRRVRRGVEQVTNGFDRLVQSSLERFTPVGEARQELDLLRQRLDQLERAVSRFESEGRSAGSRRSSAKSKPKADAAETAARTGEGTTGSRRTAKKKTTSRKRDKTTTSGRRQTPGSRKRAKRSPSEVPRKKGPKA